MIFTRRIWRYQRINQNSYIEEEQTTQWPKENKQKDKQQSTKHTHKTKGRVTRPSLKTVGELRCSGRVSKKPTTYFFLSSSNCNGGIPITSVVPCSPSKGAPRTKGKLLALLLRLWNIETSWKVILTEVLYLVLHLKEHPELKVNS